MGVAPQEVQTVFVDGGEVIRPFRWDVTRRSQLGSLAEITPPETYPEFEDDLLFCCAEVLSFAGDSDLVFVGRSPQVLFDLLSGLLSDTSRRDRLHLLNLSLSGEGPPSEEQVRAIYPYLAEVGLEPHAMMRRKQTVALVDVVFSGETFGTLVGLLKDWSDQVSAEWPAVARKIRIVGLTQFKKTSPKTWRWQQHAEWVRRLRPHKIMNVSVTWPLRDYLAIAPKTSDSFGAMRWGDEEVARPDRGLEAQEALALAVHLFDVGRKQEWRHALARALTWQPAMKERWFRSLILELKR
jgi:hypothetical protein